MFVEAGQIDVQGVGEVGEVPVLHHDDEVKHEDAGGQEGARQLGGGEKVPVEPVPRDPVGRDHRDHQRRQQDRAHPKEQDPNQRVGLPNFPRGRKNAIS